MQQHLGTTYSTIAIEVCQRKFSASVASLRLPHKSTLGKGGGFTGMGWRIHRYTHTWLLPHIEAIILEGPQPWATDRSIGSNNFCSGMSCRKRRAMFCGPVCRKYHQTIPNANDTAGCSVIDAGSCTRSRHQMGATLPEPAAAPTAMWWPCLDRNPLPSGSIMPDIARARHEKRKNLVLCLK
jgi:hypothetical protein